MPLDQDDGITPDFIQEKNKLENRPIHLYTLYDYDGLGNDLRFAAYDQDVVFDSKTYQKFPIRHDFVGENTSGEVDVLKIQISNISREIQSYLETYDLRGKRVSVTTVFANLLDDPTTFRQDTYYIDSYGANVETVEFNCTSKFDLMKTELPARKFWRNYCGWKFKSVQCGYAGAETHCNKTFQRCGELNNKTRFGGFPSIPSRMVYIS